MRVWPAGVLLTLVCLSAAADQAVWKIDLLERAIRRADPAHNAERRAAWIAAGRPGVPRETDDVIIGSHDPSVLAPIELVVHTYPIFNLDRERQERIRRDWDRRGAAELLGADYWERLRDVCNRAVLIDREIRRMHTRTREEQSTLSVTQSPQAERSWSDRGECEAEAAALQAGRATWGENFDRFLYEVVAPGVSFVSSSSDPSLLRDADYWVEEWTLREKACDFDKGR